MNKAMSRPFVLVTNDDGINSAFLKVLLNALKENFEVAVAAPKKEQSWIGRAFSRHNDVTVEPYKEGPVDLMWAIDGTPTDCVNIALDHLMPRKPDLVISGINIGYNTTYTLMLSSGTVAGAIEGTTWGIPSIALSQVVKQEHFAELRKDNSKCPEFILEQVRKSAKHAAQYAFDIAGRKMERLSLYNVNYPEVMSAESKLVRTQPADVFFGGLYELKDGVARFRFNAGKESPSENLTDREALMNGNISVTKLSMKGIAG